MQKLIKALEVISNAAWVMRLSFAEYVTENQDFFFLLFSCKMQQRRR